MVFGHPPIPGARRVADLSDQADRTLREIELAAREIRFAAVVVGSLVGAVAVAVLVLTVFGDHG